MDWKDLNKYSEPIQKVYNSPEFIKINTFLKTEDSFLGLLATEHRESIHSNFLYWLLNPSSNHDLGDYPIKRFIASALQVLISSNYENKEEILKECRIIEKDNGKDSLDLLNSLLTMNYEIDSLSRVGKEVTLENRRRPDLVLSLTIKVREKVSKKKSKVNDPGYSINVIIENKALSNENDKQTSAYFNEFQKKDTKNIYVYLLPMTSRELKNLKESIPECKNFITLNQ